MKTEIDKLSALLVAQGDPLIAVLLFRRAMELAAVGEPILLSSMLKSDNPHSEYARARLAAYIAVKPRLKRGRKPNPAVIDAAADVEMFKRELRAAGFKIYGFRDPDKKAHNRKSHEDIVDFVLNERSKIGLPIPDKLALDNYLRRPQHSRAKKVE